MDKSKKILLITVATGIIAIFAVMAVVFRSVEKNAEPSAEAVLPESGARLCDGVDWCGIDSIKAPDAVKELIKGDFLKLSIESNALSGNPLQSANLSIPGYITFMDNFYKDADNRVVPTFFVVKMAEMAGNNTDNAAITAYKLKVTQKLKDSGLVK